MSRRISIRSHQRYGSPKMVHLWRLTRGLVLPLLLFLAWWIGTSTGWISVQTLPTPASVADAFRALWDSGELIGNLKVSLTRVCYGTGIGVAVGLVLGLWMGLSPKFRQYVYPSFRIFAYVPLLGWVPLLMILLGIGESLKYVLIAKAVVVPVVFNSYDGIKAVDRQYLEVASIYDFSRWQTIRRVLLPAAFPQIWTGIRFGLTKAWLLLVVVEMLASSEGIGYMSISGQQLLQLDLVMVAVIVIGTVGFALDKFLEIFEKILLRWRVQAF